LANLSQGVKTLAFFILQKLKPRAILPIRNYSREVTMKQKTEDIFGQMAILFLIVALAGALFVMLPVAIYQNFKFQRDCEALGGRSFMPRGGALCIKDGKILDMP